MTRTTLNWSAIDRREWRIYEVTSASEIIPEIDTYDIYLLTAQDQNLTIKNHVTSVPHHAEIITIEIVPDDSYTITHESNYVSKAGISLPSGTTPNKRLTLGYRWASDIGKYVIFLAAQES